MSKKKIMLIVGVVVLVLLGIFLFLYFSEGDGEISRERIEVIPLTNGENEKVTDTLEGSEFIEDVPSKGVISLRFYSFENGVKLWHDDYLIGKSRLLNEGNPDIYLTLKRSYIENLNSENLCATSKSANENGDLGFFSESSKAKLLVKYSGMLKHRECFGF